MLGQKVVISPTASSTPPPTRSVSSVCASLPFDPSAFDSASQDGVSEAEGGVARAPPRPDGLLRVGRVVRVAPAHRAEDSAHHHPHSPHPRDHHPHRPPAVPVVLVLRTPRHVHLLGHQRPRGDHDFVSPTTGCTNATSVSLPGPACTASCSATPLISASTPCRPTTTSMASFSGATPISLPSTFTCAPGAAVMEEVAHHGIRLPEAPLGQSALVGSGPDVGDERAQVLQGLERAVRVQLGEREVPEQRGARVDGLRLQELEARGLVVLAVVGLEPGLEARVGHLLRVGRLDGRRLRGGEGGGGEQREKGQDREGAATGRVQAHLPSGARGGSSRG